MVFDPANPADGLALTHSTLATILDQVQQWELHEGGSQALYEARNKLLTFAMAAAASEGVAYGIRLDRGEPAWPVLYFELPDAGQVSWHLPQHERPWDGHDTAEKRRRVATFVEANRRPARVMYVIGNDGITYGPFEPPIASAEDVAELSEPREPGLGDVPGLGDDGPDDVGPHAGAIIREDSFSEPWD